LVSHKRHAFRVNEYEKTFLHGILDEKIYMEQPMRFSYIYDHCRCSQNNLQKVLQDN